MRRIISAAMLAAFAVPLHAADDAAVLDLAKKSGCFACHAVDKKMVGPAWQDVGKKYAGVAGAEAQLVVAVKKGGKANWGAIPMPPNATIKDADVQALVKYILALK